MEKGKLTLTTVTKEYYFESDDGSMAVSGRVKQSVGDGKLIEFTGVANKLAKEGVGGENLGNFRGVPRGEKIAYSLSEATLDNQAAIQAVIREIEPQLIESVSDGNQ